MTTQSELDEVRRYIHHGGEFVCVESRMGDWVSASDHDRIVSSLHARIEAAEAQWQPIESAPKHGEILVCGGTFTHSSGDYPYWKTKGVAMVHWDTDEWRGEDHEDGYYLYRPTYWRVLPPPPDSAIQGEG